MYTSVHMLPYRQSLYTMHQHKFYFRAKYRKYEVTIFFIENHTHLESFRFGIAPELFKMCNLLVRSIYYDKGEKAIIYSFLKGFEKALTIGIFHILLILILQHLYMDKHNTTQNYMWNILYNNSCLIYW